jgi:hypothetical protein
MEDKAGNEYGIVSVVQETKFNETFFIVHVTHRGIPTDAVPHLPYLLTTTSRDELRSFLATLDVTSYCSNYGPSIGPTGLRPCSEISPCTVDDIMLRFDNPLLQPLDLIVGHTSEQELKNRVKQWQETEENKAHSQVPNNTV